MAMLRKKDDVLVEPVVALDLLAKLNFLNLSRRNQRLLKKIQQQLKAPIYVKAPSALLEFDVVDKELLKAIGVAEGLKAAGVLNNIVRSDHIPDEPFFYRFRRIASHRSDGGGADFFSESTALWACLGEAYERHLWRYSDFYKENFVRTSYAKIRTAALDIYSLAGFLPEQKEEFPILQFDEETEFGWTMGRTLLSQQKVWCPSQLVSRKYAAEHAQNPHTTSGDEPMLRWPITTGLATASNQAGAVVKGILEVSERDAFMCTFLNKKSPALFSIDKLKSQDVRLKIVLERFENKNLDIYLSRLENRLGVPTVLAIVIDRSGKGPFCTMGAAANFNYLRSIEKALSEALFVRYSIKNNYEYRHSNRMGLAERIRYYAQEENFSKISFLIEGEYSNQNLDLGFAEVQEESSITELRRLQSALKVIGMDGVYVPLTDPVVQGVPLHTVHVTIPQMQPLHPDEKIPYWGGGAIRKVSFNKDPHPFP